MATIKSERKNEKNSVCYDYGNGEDDEAQNRQCLETEMDNVQGQHPGPAECAEAVE